MTVARSDYKKDFSKYFFLKKHNRVIEALLNNSIDAAGTFDQVVYDTQKLYANQIKILAVSYPIPLDVFISSSKLNFQDTNNIKKLLLEYKAKPEINQILGFTKVKENVFEDIKSIIKSNNY
ncbi:PhnD/SsuA/transferrin family substrate-binding protein [Malaciobacter mytili]|uniref:PhnD/SsuA/transferrin family substrate-binding protein n=1 Tax=Malaciobacter mytili TaxID=603050 RepID=UPI003BB1F35B